MSEIHFYQAFFAGMFTTVFSVAIALAVWRMSIPPQKSYKVKPYDWADEED